MKHARHALALVLVLWASCAGEAPAALQKALADAVALHQSAKFAEAAAAYRVLWEADPGLIEAHVGYQDASRRAGTGDELVDLYRERAKERDAAVDHYLYGRIAKTRDAAKALGKALSADPGLVRARACLAHVLIDKGSAKQAGKESTLAVEQSEERLLSASGDPAIAAAGRELALTLVTRGWVRESSGATVEAIADYKRAIVLDPELARAYASLGFLLEAEDKREEAIATFGRAHELDPVSVAAVCTLARLQHEVAIEARSERSDGEEEGDGGGEGGEEGGDGEGARIGRDPSGAPGLAVLDNALKLMPDEPELHYTRGIILSETPGSRSAAAKTLQRAIELDPEDVYYRTALAETYSHLGKHSRARETALAAVKVDRKSAEAYRALGVASMALEEWKQGIDAFGRAMTLAPRNSALPFWQAECFEKRQDVKKAIGAYERSAKLDPEDPEPHKRMGILYETQRSNRKAALASYERYIELGGKDGRVKDWIRELEE